MDIWMLLVSWSSVGRHNAGHLVQEQVLTPNFKSSKTFHLWFMSLAEQGQCVSYLKIYKNLMSCAGLVLIKLCRIKLSLRNKLHENKINLAVAFKSEM